MSEPTLLFLVCLAGSSPPSADCSWKVEPWPAGVACIPAVDAAAEALEPTLPRGAMVARGLCWQRAGVVSWRVSGGEQFGECDLGPALSPPGGRALHVLRPFYPPCWSEDDFAAMATAGGR